MPKDYSFAIPYPPDKMRTCDTNKRSVLTQSAHSFKQQIRDEINLLGHNSLMLGGSLKVRVDFYYPKCNRMFDVEEIINELENSDMIKNKNCVECVEINFKKSQSKKQTIVTVWEI